MDTLVTQVSNTQWWLSVVVVGIVINLVSTLLGTFIQRRYSWLVRSWSERTEKLAKERRVRLKLLTHSDYDLSLAMQNLNKMRLDNIFDFVLCVVLLAFSAAFEDSHTIFYLIARIVALLSLMTGMIGAFRYGQESLLITEAQLMNLERRLSKVDATNDAQPSIPDVIE